MNQKTCSCGRCATTIYTDPTCGSQRHVCYDCYDIESARDEGYATTGEYYSDEEVLDVLKNRSWKSHYRN